MKIVVAPDSFKGTYNAEQVSRAMAEGIHDAVPGAEVVLRPMADGGEGSLEAVLGAMRAERITVDTADSYGRPITAAYGFQRGTAWVELAQASGLQFLDTRLDAPARNRAALRASTWGTGIQLRQALQGGASRVFLMIGGSGTTDGGWGLLAGLGARCTDSQGNLLGGEDARNMGRVDRIENLRAVRALLQDVSLVVATDVSNPLCGPAGAAWVYGPQKGLSVDGVRLRDAELAHWGKLLTQAAGVPETVMVLAGMGAAGGAAFPLQVLAPTMRVVRGAVLVAESIGLEAAIRDADLVLTGEGATDAQTMEGKVPLTVLQLSRQYGKRCAVVSGRLGDGYQRLAESGPVHFEQASPAGASLEDIQANGLEWIAQAAARAVQAITAE